MQEKTDTVTAQYYYGDSVFKDVMQSVLDNAWIAEWEKLDVRVKNRKSADLEEFRTGLKDLSSLYNSVWLKNVIKKCCGDLFDSLKVLLEKLYEDRIEWRYGVADFAPLQKKAIVKRQYLPTLLFGLLPRLSPELQKQILVFMIGCVNERVHNVEVFFEMDILRKLIFMLMSIHKYNVFDASKPEEIPAFDCQLSEDTVKVIFDFICTLASHNIRPQDLKTMLLPLRLGTFASEADESKPGVLRSADYLSALLRIARPSNVPPAFFSWNEPATGLSMVPAGGLPKNGYTVFCWLRIESFPRAGTSLPVFAFRGVNGRMVEVKIQNGKVVVSSTEGKGEEARLEAELAVKENTWFWLGVSHTKKSMWRSSLSIFLNDKLLLEDKFNYPENLDGGSKGSLSLEFAHSEEQRSTASDGADYRFQMCSMGMLQAALSEAEMNQLFMLHHGVSYSLRETPSNEQWSTAQQKLLEKCVCYFEARNTRDNLCYDCNGQDVQATVSEGTRIVSESTLTQTLASLGGVPVILPMFVPASAEVSITHLPELVPQPLPSRAYAQALSLLAILLQEDPSQLITFKNNGGVQLLAMLLRHCPASHLSVEFVTVIQQIVAALKTDEELYVAGIRYLLFDFSVWGSAPWTTHVIILRMLGDMITSNPAFIKTHVGIRPLLQALVKIYYSEPSQYSCKRDSSFTDDGVLELQQSVCEMLQSLLDSDAVSYYVDISYLLSVLYMVDDSDVLLGILGIIYHFLNQPTIKPNFLQSLCRCKAHTVFLKCFCHEMEEVRILAIRCLHCFWVASSPAAKLACGINDFKSDESSGIADFLNDNPVTLNVYQALMDFALGIKPESVARGVVDGRRPLAIQYPFVLNALLESLCEAKDAVRDTALSHLQSLVMGVTSASANRVTIAQSPSAIRCLVTLYALTQTESTRDKARQILVACTSTYVLARMGGWEIIEQIRQAVESLTLLPMVKGITVESRGVPLLSFAELFSPLLLGVLQQLQESIRSQKPKRKDPSGQVFFEGYAMSAYLALSFILGITPDVPRLVEVRADGGIQSVHALQLNEPNTITDASFEILRLALGLWQEVAPQLTSATDIVLCEGSKPSFTPIPEKGVLPVLIRALEAAIVFLMRRLYTEGQSAKGVVAEIEKYMSLLESLLLNLNIIYKPKSSEISLPKNDWCNQLILNTSFTLFSVIGICTRITTSLSSTAQDSKEAKTLLAVWEGLSAQYWELMSLCLRNIATLLSAMDEATFGVLRELERVKAQNLQTYNTWINVFSHDFFRNAVEGMRKMHIAYKDQFTVVADSRLVENVRRYERCRSEESPLNQRLEEEMGETILQFVEAFEKDAMLSIVERETNGLKILKKLWRELVFGPSMWHGVENLGENDNDRDRVYYQLDRKETEKRLRNRMKRDWHERPHRHIGRDLTGSKGKNLSGEQELLKLRVYKKQTDEAESLPVDEEPTTPTTPTGLNVEEEVNNLDLKFTHGERVVYSTQMQLVLPMCVVEGRTDITPTHVFFFPEGFAEGHEGAKKELHVRRWEINGITEVYRRRYLLAPTGLEIMVNNKSYFWNFPVSGDYQKVFSVLLLQKPKHILSRPLFKHLYSPAQLVAKADWTTLWQRRQMSNFEYLMKLNMAAGRSYNDIQQYPVFPWVIADYTSTELDLNKPESFRDLSKPIGALNEERLEGIMERYTAMEGGDIPPFMYGSHYSNVGTVLNFLVRMEPFAELAARLQGGHFDWADRLFHSIEEAWTRVLTSTGDLKELTPEFFYSPHFLYNMNGLDLGKRQDGTVLDDVILPPWASSPEEFIRINMQALESDYVSEHLSDWIDLIFGYKQRGVEAEKAYNVFYYLTYEGMVDMEAVTDPEERKAIESQIANFGQTPSQLFTTPHPKRFSAAGALAALGIKILPGTVLKPQGVTTQHHAALVNLMYRDDDKEVLSVDAQGKVGLHRYYAAMPGHKLFPFTFQSSDKPPIKRLPCANAFPTSVRSRVIHSIVPGDEQTYLSQMRARLCVDPKFQRLFSTGHFDSIVAISSLQNDEEYKLSYNAVVGTCLALTEDATEIVVGSREGLVMVWNVEMDSTITDPLVKQSRMAARLPRLILPGLPSKVLQVCASRDLDLIMAATAMNQVYLFNLRDGCFVQVIDLAHHLEKPVTEDKKQPKPNYRITQLLTTWNGYVVVTVTSLHADLPNALFCFDVNGRLLYKRADVRRIHTTCTSKDSKWLFCASSHNICIFTLPDLRLNTVLSSPNLRVDSICVSSDNRALLAGVQDGSVLCFGLNLRWKDSEEAMPAAVDEQDLGNLEDME